MRKNYAAVRDGYKLDKTRRELSLNAHCGQCTVRTFILQVWGAPKDGNCFGDTLVD